MSQSTLNTVCALYMNYCVQNNHTKRSVNFHRPIASSNSRAFN